MDKPVKSSLTREDVTMNKVIKMSTIKSLDENFVLFSSLTYRSNDKCKKESPFKSEGILCAEETTMSNDILNAE
jgi:hypothetical protein